jgi:hypothetical protein
LYSDIVSYIWRDRGLFWRAGLICALMKTMAPSAIIFGPMIAIFAESLLLELSVRIFGRTLAGYLLGSMLAMSWNLFQKIANYIISYGSNIVEVYNSLLKFAQRQLNIQTDIVWLLLFFYSSFSHCSVCWQGSSVLLRERKAQTACTGISFSRNNFLTGSEKIQVRILNTLLFGCLSILP